MRCADMSHVWKAVRYENLNKRDNVEELGPKRR
jgi:hypothetical protein